jgi:hypothetical protein
MQTTERIAWEGNIDAALERAEAEHRLVFLDVFNPG